MSVVINGSTGIVAPDGTNFINEGNANGTLVESGGDVTGGLFEQGSNANGSYIKFADGTMICWRNDVSMPVTLSTANIFGSTAGTVYVDQDGTDITFPAAFAAAPAVTVVANDASAMFGMYARNVTATTANIVGYKNTSATLTAGYIAIGRWF